MPGFHIAQVNVAHARAPLDTPRMAEFMALLDPINALADASPGFVWRLQDEDGNATSIHPTGDERFIVNLSVWESVEALRGFVYASRHLEVMRRRREWFERLATAHVALWWVAAGTVPSVEEALARVARLEADGPTPDAFTFKQRHPAPSGAAASTHAERPEAVDVRARAERSAP